MEKIIDYGTPECIIPKYDNKLEMKEQERRKNYGYINRKARKERFKRSYQYL